MTAEPNAPGPNISLSTPESVEQVTRSPGLQAKSFASLQALPPEPDWLWRGFLVPGSLTLLAGHPFSGKSMVVSALLGALEDGKPFLGQATKRASALLVTEEDDATLGERARLFGLFAVKSEYVSRSSTAMAEWAGLISAATDVALRAGHRLLVIDTFPGLAGLLDEQENDAGAIGQKLRPLQHAAGAGLSVLLLHHMNSQGQPRGSKAFRGIVDISARLRRSPNSRVIQIHSESRFPTATAEKVAARLVQAPDGWFYERLLAETSSNSTDSAPTDQRLLKVLTQTDKPCLKYSDFEGIDGLSRDIAKKRLPHWLGTKVGRHGTGTRTDPFCWYPIAA